MTDAQRQQKHRDKLRDIARRQLMEAKRAAGIAYALPVGIAYQPPKGYSEVKAKLEQQGHHFERARREFGFEQGTFIDGAFINSGEVFALIDLPMAERQQWLAGQRQQWKDFAVDAVMAYMGMMRVSLELVRYDVARKEEHARMREGALLKERSK